VPDDPWLRLSKNAARRLEGAGFWWHSYDGERSLKYALHDLETARKHYSAMRDLIIHRRGGSRDERTLGKLWDLSRKAAAPIDDSTCKSLLSAVDGYGADLFSESGFLKWARAQISGADFLRLKILSELDAFHTRLLQLQLEVTRNDAARLAANVRPDRR
jgi:hypothetical protein